MRICVVDYSLVQTTIKLLEFYKLTADQKLGHANVLWCRSVMNETRDAMTRGQMKNLAPYEDNDYVFTSRRGREALKSIYGIDKL